jgi:hypothetical protein
MGYGPVPAIRGLLKSSGLTVDQVGFVLSRRDCVLILLTPSFRARLTCSKSTRRLLDSACYRRYQHCAPCFHFACRVTCPQISCLREGSWSGPLPLQREWWRHCPRPPNRGLWKPHLRSSGLRASEDGQEVRSKLCSECCVHL